MYIEEKIITNDCSQTEKRIVKVKRGGGNNYAIIIKILKMGVGKKG